MTWKEELKSFEWITYIFVLALGLVAMVVVLAANIPDRQIFLGDAALWRSQNEDTVPTWLAMVFMAVVSVLLAGVEYATCLRSNPSRAAYATARVWLGFVMMNILTFVFTGLLKIYVAEPRPDFLSRCFGASQVPPQQYSTEQFSSNAACDPSAEASLLRGGRQAWPSGHASSTLASAFFFACYAWWRTRKQPAFVSQLVWSGGVATLILAFFIGASRIVNNKHSTADVCSGFLIGALSSLAYLVPLIHSMDSRYYPKPRKHDASSSSSASAPLFAEDE